MAQNKIINNSILIKLRRGYNETPLTLRQASLKMKIDLSALHRMESGSNQSPRIRTVLSICEFYDISLFEILESEISNKMMESYLNKMVAQGVIPEITKNKILSHHKIMVSADRSSGQQ
jgi:DNA-binding Xre family transcriptional regulator